MCLLPIGLYTASMHQPLHLEELTWTHAQWGMCSSALCCYLLHVRAVRKHFRKSQSLVSRVSFSKPACALLKNVIACCHGPLLTVVFETHGVTQFFAPRETVLVVAGARECVSSLVFSSTVRLVCGEIAWNLNRCMLLHCTVQLPLYHSLLQCAYLSSFTFEQAGTTVRCIHQYA